MPGLKHRHVALVEKVVLAYRSKGWMCRTEAPIYRQPEYLNPQFADLLVVDPEGGAVCEVVEVKRNVTNQRRLDTAIDQVLGYCHWLPDDPVAVLATEAAFGPARLERGVWVTTVSDLMRDVLASPLLTRDVA